MSELRLHCRRLSSASEWSVVAWGMQSIIFPVAGPHGICSASGGSFALREPSKQTLFWLAWMVCSAHSTLTWLGADPARDCLYRRWLRMLLRGEALGIHLPGLHSALGLPLRLADVALAFAGFDGADGAEGSTSTITWHPCHTGGGRSRCHPTETKYGTARSSLQLASRRNMHVIVWASTPCAGGSP